MFPALRTLNVKDVSKAEGISVRKKITAMMMTATFLLSACTAEPMSKVIEKDIPFNVKEIIHKEKVKDGVILLYVTEQKDKRGQFDAVTVAFLKGNDQEGWENAGHNHWEHEENEPITVYTDVFYDYDRNGRIQNRLPVIYGKVEDQQIDKVEVFGEIEGVDKARIIQKESGRYYMKVGDYTAARGILNEGGGMGRPD